MVAYFVNHFFFETRSSVRQWDLDFIVGTWSGYLERPQWTKLKILKKKCKPQMHLLKTSPESSSINLLYTFAALPVRMRKNYKVLLQNIQHFFWHLNSAKVQQMLLFLLRKALFEHIAETFFLYGEGKIKKRGTCEPSHMYCDYDSTPGFGLCCHILAENDF